MPWHKIINSAHALVPIESVVFTMINRSHTKKHVEKTLTTNRLPSWIIICWKKTKRTCVQKNNFSTPGNVKK